MKTKKQRASKPKITAVKMGYKSVLYKKKIKIQYDLLNIFKQT